MADYDDDDLFKDLYGDEDVKAAPAKAEPAAAAAAAVSAVPVPVAASSAGSAIVAPPTDAQVPPQSQPAAQDDKSSDILAQLQQAASSARSADPRLQHAGTPVEQIATAPPATVPPPAQESVYGQVHHPNFPPPMPQAPTPTPMSMPAAHGYGGGGGGGGYGGGPPQHMQQQRRDEGKMFIGGLNWETTDESMRTYFEQFGRVTDCMVMRDGASGRSRGFGFLTFADADVVTVVVQKEHFLDGKIIDPKRAIPRDEQEKTAKMFVGGVPQDCDEEQFKDFFGQFGKVIDATLMIDKDTGRPRGFGFVTFEREDAVDRAMAVRDLNIRGKAIEVKKATPKGQQDGAPGRFNRNSGPPPGGSYQQAPRDDRYGGGQQNNQQAYGGVSPAMMAQYYQRMQAWMAQMQQHAARNPGQPGQPGQNPMAGMNPMMMQQMMQMQGQMQQGQPQGGQNDGSGGGGGGGDRRDDDMRLPTGPRGDDRDGRDDRRDGGRYDRDDRRGGGGRDRDRGGDRDRDRDRGGRRGRGGYRGGSRFDPYSRS